MKKQSFVPEFNGSADFSDSVVGLDQGKKYLVYIVNSSVNSMATGSDNKNIVVSACPISRAQAEEPLQASDFVESTVGSRAFKDAGVVSAAQKKQAMKDRVPFELSWTPGEERPATKDREAYTPKVWKSKRIIWDSEEEG